MATLWALQRVWLQAAADVETAAAATRMVAA
jgi:hypothetical protein